MKVVPKKQWRYPLSLERTYAKLLVAHVQRIVRTVNGYVPEIRNIILGYAVHIDADEENSRVNTEIAVVVDHIRRACESSEAMRGIVQKIFDNVGRYNQQEFGSIMKSFIGYVPDDIGPEDLGKLKDIWVQQNLDLIRSIDDETMNRIRLRMAERIIQNVDSVSLTKDLIQDIKNISNAELKRAALIGTDQVGKLNGMLSRYRQQHAGIDEYQWRSCHDSRVRPAHSARDGTVYSWSNPPPDGHPGHPIRCRCVALPVIDFDTIRIPPQSNSYIVTA